MNLLEHYIKEVYSEEDITKEFEEKTGYPPCEPMVRVKMKIDCYGIEEGVEHVFFITEWEETRKQGYYMA